MDPIITFTDTAVTHIKSLMAKEANAIGFRLSLKKTGCSGYAYVPEIISASKNNDLQLKVQDDLNVYLDTTHQSFIQGLLVDFVEENKSGLKQKRLVFINPNEKNRCGCGESFTIEKNNDDA